MGLENYVECKLIDGTFFDFDRMCNKVDGYNEDMISFLCKNYDNDDNKFICLGVIPKNQIKYIQFHNSKGTLEKLFNKVEYIEKPKISKKDRAFLSFIKDIYPYIARDEDGALRLYSRKPCKVERGTGLILFQFDIELPMVKWEDEEPWLIEDLKKLEVVEEYENN